MDTLLSRYWHHLPQQEVATLLESDIAKGFDTFEVAHRQAHFGPNHLTQKKGRSPFVLFLLQFHQPLVYILLAAVAITFALQEWIDSGVIFAVVLVNAVIGFIQESKARKAIEALAHAMEGMATVVRAGQKEQIAASELVPGDLVLLQSGDKVPADLRLLRTREIQIDESALTGESVPAQKQPERLLMETVLADRGIMARPPQCPQTPIITRELGFRIGLVSLMLLLGTFGLYEWALLNGRSVDAARTLAVNMFVFGQLFYLFNCRSLRYSMFKLGVFSNRWLLFGVSIMALLQIFFTHSAAMNRLFGSAPLELVEWALILTGGLIIYGVVGAEKWLRRRTDYGKDN